MTLDLDDLEYKAKAAGGDQWSVQWFECKADSDDVRHAATKPLKQGEKRELLSVGDVLWRVPLEIGPISPDHNHWAGNYLACSEEEAEFAASANPATMLALVAHIRRLQAENDTRDALRMQGEAQVASLLVEITSLRAEKAKLREALAWYGENARLCRLVHREGDAGRHALSDDGGGRARAAIEEVNHE
jgi:hypothetical protein